MIGRALPIVAAVAALGGVYFVWSRGGVAQAGQALGSAIVNGAGGVVSGGVGAVSEAVGLPTPAQTTTDAQVARWIIDNIGTFKASQWAGAPAFLEALMMPAGSGRAPDPNSAAGRALLPLVTPQASYDETERLLNRFPAPYTAGPESVFSGEATWGGLAGLGQGGFDWLPNSY